jgi:uncharacterized protein
MANMTKRRGPRGITPEEVMRVMEAEEQARQKALDTTVKTHDSFQNFAAGMGVGTDNITSSSTYGFNPVTRNRILLEWIYRGSWLAGVAVDVVADDMTRAGVDFVGEIVPEDEEKINQTATRLNIWGSLASVIKWSRLYGGALGVLMIDGQAPHTPLNLATIGKGQFRGILPVDRWMVQPSLQNLITELGPNYGLPKYYQIVATGGMPGWKVHHTRVIRLIGIELPYWQRVSENMWGLSIFERIFDRLVAFDSATQGAAQLVYKAYLRVQKLKGFRQAVGTPAEAGIINSMEFNRRYQSLEGIAVIDADDDMQIVGHTAFSGLAEALVHFGQQLSGALQIPLVRLFGQSPAGLNSSGDSDLRTYYDGINKDQVARLHTPVHTVYRCIAASEGIAVPDNFDINFRDLWQLRETEKAAVANQDTNSILAAHEAGVISTKTALMELRQLSRITGRFSSITDDDIAAAEETPPPPGELSDDQRQARQATVTKLDKPGDPPPAATPRTSVPAAGIKPPPPQVTVHTPAGEQAVPAQPAKTAAERQAEKIAEAAPAPTE